MAEGAPLLREYGSKAHRGFESLPLRQIQKSPASRGFFVSDREVGKIQNPVRSTRVRLPGRRAREKVRPHCGREAGLGQDIDEGDARRARTMDGPSQSLPEITNPAFYESKLKFPTFIIATTDIINGII